MKAKKEVKVLFSSEPGAMFITMETCHYIEYGRCYIWPAVWGLKKYRGYTEFGRGIDKEPANDAKENHFMYLTRVECKRVYFDAPKKEEAWLVVPVKGGYEWTRVDDQIDFSG